MQHFPIFLSTRDQTIVVSGGGDAALAKLRLLLKTEAQLRVFSPEPCAEILLWAQTGKLELIQRPLGTDDVAPAILFYAADEDNDEDARTSAIARSQGALVNIVDNLESSQFITPAIVDRDPVTVAIGTEGAAPVLARAIKADLEERLPASLGLLARIGKTFRPMAEKLPFGRARRNFWSDFYQNKGPAAFAIGGPPAVRSSLDALLVNHLAAKTDNGRVDFICTEFDDPDLLTLQARKLIDSADVIIHDSAVAAGVLELARREARVIDAGAMPQTARNPQETTRQQMCALAQAGQHVVRLHSGAAATFENRGADITTFRAAGIAWRIVPAVSATDNPATHAGQTPVMHERKVKSRDINGRVSTFFQPATAPQITPVPGTASASVTRLVQKEQGL